MIILKKFKFMFVSIVLVVAISFSLASLLSGCSFSNITATEDTLSYSNTCFVDCDFTGYDTKVDGNYRFMYDINTNVMYVRYEYIGGGYLAGAMTVMYNSDGKVMTYDEWYKLVSDNDFDTTYFVAVDFTGYATKVDGHYDYLYDRYSKVMYVRYEYTGVQNLETGLTPLYNTDGSVMTYENWKKLMADSK